MHIIITYKGFKNEWRGIVQPFTVLHHGNLAGDNMIFGWEYWVGVCEGYMKTGFKHIKAIIVDSYELSYDSKADNSLFYEPKEEDLVIEF
jgi:hypothetical protein